MTEEEQRMLELDPEYQEGLKKINENRKKRREFNEKKIPFIIKRPYGNTFEYWKLNDLLN